MTRPGIIVTCDPAGLSRHWHGARAGALPVPGQSDSKPAAGARTAEGPEWSYAAAGRGHGHIPTGRGTAGDGPVGGSSRSESLSRTRRT
jgi:hypothetical protein